MVSIGFVDHVGRVLFTVCVDDSHHRRPFWPRKNPVTQMMYKSQFKKKLTLWLVLWSRVTYVIFSKTKHDKIHYTLKKMLDYFFKPNAGFSLLGHFIGLFLIFLPRCWVIFNTGLFFLPNHWVEPVSDETTQLLSYSQSTGFLSPLQERVKRYF